MSFASILLAASVVESAVVQSPQIGTFFSLPQWMPTAVASSRTPGSTDATNATQRLDPTALAAVNACFEAYYERLYFGYAGPSNVWDTSVYGPICRSSDKHTFRFALPTNAPSPFVYAPDTNRVIETRRLVEYLNLKRLADTLRTSDPLKIERPGWWRNNNVYGFSTYGSRAVMWSSTLFDGLVTNYGTAGSPFPNVAWSVPATFLSSQGSKKWFDTALGWPHPDNGSVLEWWSQYGSGYNVADLAADEVNFGDPAMTDNREDYMYSGEINLTNTADSVVGQGVYVYGTCIVTNHFDDTDFIGDVFFSDICDYICSLPDVTNKPYVVTFTVTNMTVTGCDGHQVDVDEIYVVSIESNDIEMTKSSGFLLETDNAIDAFVDQFNSTTLTATFNVDVSSEDEWYVDSFTPEDVLYQTSVSFRLGYTEIVTNIVGRRIGVEGLTNDTRRLYTDRLAGLGLTLGALDRTYAHLASPIPSVVTQYNHSATKFYGVAIEDQPQSQLAWDGSEWSVDINDQDVPPLTLTGSTHTNYPSGSAVVGGRYVKYVTDMYRTFGKAATIETLAHPVMFEQSHIDSMIPSSIQNGRFWVYFDSASVNGTGGVDLSCDVRAFDEDTQTGTAEILSLCVSYGPTALPTGSCVTVSASTAIYYSSGHTVGEPEWSTSNIPYPGDFSRVSQTSRPVLWSVNGAARLRGRSGAVISLSTALTDANYDPSYPSTHGSRYSASRSTYTTAAALLSAERSFYASLVSECQSMFDAEMGASFNAFDPIANLAAVERGIREANTLSGFGLYGASVVSGFSSVVGHSVPAGKDRVLSCLEGVVSSGVAYPTVAVYVTRQGEQGESASLPLVVGAWTFSVRGEPTIRSGYEPENTDIYGVKVNGKMSPWSKVDWEWKALKRTKR